MKFFYFNALKLVSLTNDIHLIFHDFFFLFLLNIILIKFLFFLKVYQFKPTVKTSFTKVHILTRTALKPQTPYRFRMATIALVIFMQDIFISRILYHEELSLEIFLL